MTSSAIQALLQIKDHPAFAQGPGIGSRGYAMPRLGQPLVIPVREDSLALLKERGITVEGVPGEGVVIIMDADLPKLDIRCRFNGCSNTTVILGQGKAFTGHLRFSGAGGMFVSAGFGSMGDATRLSVTLNPGCAAYFGTGVTSVGSEWLAEAEPGEPCAIMVGDDCMISWGVWCRNYDSHAVIDIDSLSVINNPGNIILGPHCWLGQDVRIARGVRIGAGSIIGLSSVVTQDIPACSAAAGSPARVVRERVTWSRGRRPSEGEIKTILSRL